MDAAVLPSRARMLARALARRCLLCGRGGIFRRWLTLAPRCPRCGYRFDREEGYWVGALIVNTGATQVAFFVWFLGGLALTWPDVPWNVLLVGGIGLMILFPVVFYPWAKMLWLWVDFLLHPLANATRGGRLGGAGGARLQSDGRPGPDGG